MKESMLPIHKNFFANNEKIGSPIYSQGLFMLFEKQFSFDSLEQAVRVLLEKNDALRITIEGEELCFNDTLDVNIPYIEVDTKEELDRLLSQKKNIVFCPNKALIDACIVRYGKKTGILFSAHHIITDGFCVSVIVRQICSYLGLEENCPSRSYLDFLASEKDYRTSKRHQKDISFWEKEWECRPETSLFSPSLSDGYESEEFFLPIPDAVRAEGEKYCRQKEILLPALFSSAVGIYLARTQRTENFCIGTPVINRTTREELETIGLYMHVVPFVTHFSSCSFEEFVLRTQDKFIDLLRHQRMTQYEILSLCCQDKKSLFDVVVDYQKLPIAKGVDIQPLFSNALSTALEIHLFEQGNLGIFIRYRTSLFTEKEISSMASSILKIIRIGLQNPARDITKMDIVPEPDKEKIKFLSHGKNIDYDYPSLCSVWKEDFYLGKTEGKDFFEKVDKVDALVRSFTPQKSTVALLFDRSDEMYEAIYGVIRGGNAYLPLSPEYPEERIRYILQDSKASLLLTDGKNKREYDFLPCRVLEESMRYNPMPTPPIEKKDTAYIIYTSGSTGKPKGAVISHEAIINRLLWMKDEYKLNSSDVFLQKTPYTFDVSIWEIFLPSVVGGKLVYSKPNEHFIPSKIVDEIAENKVTVLHFVPSVFTLFTKYLSENPSKRSLISSLRMIFLSGEQLHAEVVNDFSEMFPYIPMHNLYGPTECAVDVTYYACKPKETNPLPIGKPIANTQIRIVDKYGNDLPFGCKGELYILGKNVGKGYVDGTLTTQFFDLNQGIYKSGDIGYYTEEGIVFVGRKDGQIKINGQRVEIGEIEKTVLSYTGVLSSAVIAIKEKLVCFYASDKDISNDLYNYVCQKLPLYMVPYFIRKTDMPLNANGKIDKTKLMDEKILSVTEEVYSEPQNDIEKEICQAFGEVLHKKAGRDTHFVLSGGTSLDIIKLLTNYNVFDNLKLSDIILYATPSRLAEHIKEKVVSYTFLQPLFLPNDFEKALILFPFAGGDSAMFVDFVRDFVLREQKVAIFFSPLLHNNDEIDLCAKEINALSCKAKIYIWAYCVGNASAFTLLSNNRIKAEKVFSAGFLPNKYALKCNIWRFLPSSYVLHYFRTAGLDTKSMRRSQRKAFVEKCRLDADFFFYHYRHTAKINCPVQPILGKKDKFTADYKHAEECFRLITATVYKPLLFADENHYFAKSKSSFLADFILSGMEEK